MTDVVDQADIDPRLGIRVPARRRADGTISSSKTPDVRRMASEDSAALFARRPFLLIVWLIALASMNASRIVAVT